MNIYIIISLLAIAYSVGYIAGATQMHNDYLAILGTPEKEK